MNFAANPGKALLLSLDLLWDLLWQSNCNLHG